MIVGRGDVHNAGTGDSRCQIPELRQLMLPDESKLSRLQRVASAGGYRRSGGAGVR